MAKIEGWSEDEIEGRSSKLASLIESVWRAVTSIFFNNKVKANAKTITLNDLSELPTIWADELDHKVIANLGLAVYDGAEKVFKDLGVDDEQAITAMLGESGFTDFVEEYLQQASNRLTNTADEIWHDVRASLLEGYAENEDYTELAARIKHVAMMSDSRAMTIARTEMHAALEAGSYAQAKLVDPTGTKTWLATEDDRTRPTHVVADGQSATIDGTFSVGLSKLRYPGDPLGAANETINCRCTATYDLNPSDDELEKLVAEAAITAAGWDADEHPRGKDGKFIKSGTGAYDFLTGHAPSSNYDIVQAIGKISKDEWANLKPEQKEKIKKTLGKVDTYTGKKFIKKKLESFGEDDAVKAAEPMAPAAAPKVTAGAKAIQKILNDDFDTPVGENADPEVKKLIGAIEQEDWNALTPAEKKKVTKLAMYTSFAHTDKLKKLEGNAPGGVPYKPPSTPYEKAMTAWSGLDADTWAKLTPKEKASLIDDMKNAGIAAQFYEKDIDTWNTETQIKDLNAQADAIEAGEAAKATAPAPAAAPAAAPAVVPELVPSLANAVPADVYKTNPDGAVIAIGQDGKNRIRWDATKKKFQQEEFQEPTGKWAKVGPPMSKKDTYALLATNKKTKTNHWRKPKQSVAPPATAPTTVAPAIVPAVTPAPKSPWQTVMDELPVLESKDDWDKLTPAQKLSAAAKLDNVAKNTPDVALAIEASEKLNNIKAWTAKPPKKYPAYNEKIDVVALDKALDNDPVGEAYLDLQDIDQVKAALAAASDDEVIAYGKHAVTGEMYRFVAAQSDSGVTVAALQQYNPTMHQWEHELLASSSTEDGAAKAVAAAAKKFLGGEYIWHDASTLSVAPAAVPTPAIPSAPKGKFDVKDIATVAQNLPIGSVIGSYKLTNDHGISFHYRVIKLSDNTVRTEVSEAGGIPGTWKTYQKEATFDKFAQMWTDPKKLKPWTLNTSGEVVNVPTPASAPAPAPTTVQGMFDQLFNGGKTPPVFLGSDPKKPFKSNKKEDKPLTPEMLFEWVNDPTVPTGSVLGHSYDTYGEHTQFVKDPLGGMLVKKWDPHSQSWQTKGGFQSTATAASYQNYFKNAFETTFVSGDINPGNSGAPTKQTPTFKQAAKLDGPYVPESTTPGLKATQIESWLNDPDIPAGSIIGYVENEDGETFRLIKTDEGGIKSEVWSYPSQVWNPAGKMDPSYGAADYQAYLDDVGTEGGTHYSGVVDPANANTTPANPTPVAAPVLSFSDLLTGIPTETNWDKPTFDTFTSVAPALSHEDVKSIMESGVTPPKPVVLALKKGGKNKDGSDNYYRLIYDDNGLSVELASGTPEGPWEPLMGPLTSSDFDKNTISNLMSSGSVWSATFDTTQIPKTSTTAPSPASPVSITPPTVAPAVPTAAVPSIPNPTAPAAPLPPKIKTWTSYTAKKQYKNAPYSAKNSDGSVTIARTADGKSELVYTGGHNGVFMHVELDDNGVPTKVVATDKQKLAPLAKGKTWFPVFGEANPPPKVGTGKKASSTAPMAAALPDATTILTSGPTDISGFDQAFKTAVHDAAKAKNLYFNDTPEKKFKTLKQVAIANGISVAQAIIIMDEVSSAKFNVPNTNAYESAIVSWLQTPEGSAIAQGLPLPKGALPPTPSYSLISQIDSASIVEPKSETDKYSYPVISLADGNEMWEEMIKGAPLTSESTSAILTYSGSSYGSINGYLYKPKTSSSVEPKTVTHIQQGMRKSTKPIVVHRGVGMQAFGLSHGDDPSSLLGTTVLQPGFQSTSYGGKAAFDGAIQFIVEAPPGTPMVFMSGKLSGLGHSEREILLAAGLYYEILEVKKSTTPGHQWDVRARVVPAPAGI